MKRTSFLSATGLRKTFSHPGVNVMDIRKTMFRKKLQRFMVKINFDHQIKRTSFLRKTFSHPGVNVIDVRFFCKKVARILK